MSGEEIAIRRATPADAEGIVDVHIRAWQWAYRGLIPDDYLDALDGTRDRRLAFRMEWLSDTASPIGTWIAVSGGRVLGFADVQRSRDEDATPETGELSAIYLDRGVAGRGVGRALQAAAMEDLRSRGFTQATLWVLDTNERARRFYARTGWTPDGAEKTELRPGGVTLREVRYRRDL